MAVPLGLDSRDGVPVRLRARPHARAGARNPEVREVIENPPDWLEDWGRQVGAKLEDGVRENPSFIAFARQNGTVYHTYTVSAPDPFVAPYNSSLLKPTPKAQSDEFRAWRKDEYPD